MHAVLVAVGGTTTTNDQMHFVVLYAAPLAAVDAAQDTVMFYLMIGVPILIVVAGAATYVFAGRALRPVEAIRARVASMSEKDLAERVPVPAARDEVGRLAETMNAMIARLEHAQKVQRRFVADASHELRSPLATIGAGLELLQNSDPGTVVALRGETQRLGRLVDDLLLLARADERGLQPRRDEVDLDEIVEAERARPYEDGVRTEVRAEHVRVVGDRGQLVRVLRNLVDNAHRHARSRVLVTLGREGDRAVLDVVDDGPGVPAADRIRIFERFVRLDDARARADGGSGLGLAIVAEVVAAHGGQVWVEDAPGGGALFRVRLPAAELPVDEDLEPADLPAPAANGTAPPAQRRERNADQRRHGRRPRRTGPEHRRHRAERHRPARRCRKRRRVAEARDQRRRHRTRAQRRRRRTAPVPNGGAAGPAPNGGRIARGKPGTPAGIGPRRPRPTARRGERGRAATAPRPRHRCGPGAPAAGRCCAARPSRAPERTTRTPTGCRPNRRRPPRRRPTVAQPHRTTPGR